MKISIEEIGRRANMESQLHHTHRIEEFEDNGKNRAVNVQFWYPDNAEGIYPLVVFSHGAFGIKASNASTYRELASHGYVVCSIDHPYHSFYTVADDGAVTLINSEYKTEVHFLASWFMIKSLVISLQAENPTRRSFFNFLIML